MEINFEYLFVIKFIPQKSIVKFEEKFNKNDCLLELRKNNALDLSFGTLYQKHGAGASD